MTSSKTGRNCFWHAELLDKRSGTLEFEWDFWHNTMQWCGWCGGGVSHCGVCVCGWRLARAASPGSSQADETLGRGEAAHLWCIWQACTQVKPAIAAQTQISDTATWITGSSCNKIHCGLHGQTPWIQKIYLFFGHLIIKRKILNILVVPLFSNQIS